MFGRDRKEQENEIERLKDEKRKLKEELEELKLQKKMEEEDIKHMVKINNERKEIELEKEKVKLMKEKDEAIAKVKDDYRDKTEKQLERQLTDMRGMYTEILERLPNYNVKVKEDR
jgi:seryl-tRNA synthetase